MGIAPGNDVRTRTSAKQRRAVDLPVGKYQRKATLENGDTINPPASDDFVQHPLGTGKALFAFAESKIENITERQALRNILRGQRALPAQIVIVLIRSQARLQPCRQSIGIANEFGVGVSD